MRKSLWCSWRSWESGGPESRMAEGAIKAFAENLPDTFDMIFMDIMMPEMNGHLSKPIVMEELVKSIARNLNR